RAGRRTAVSGNRGDARRLARHGEVARVPRHTAPARDAHTGRMAIVIDDRALQEILKAALRSDVPIELDRDLWPRMHARLAAPPARPSLFDWTLIAAIAVGSVAFPNVILGVLSTL